MGDDNANDASFASNDHLIEEVKFIIDSFVDCNFFDTCIAHNLIRHANSFLMWMKDVPSHFNTVILANMAALN